MSIQRDDYDEIVFVCDSCDEELVTEEKDFDDALKWLKEDDWISRKKRGEWEHYCPDCQG